MTKAYFINFIEPYSISNLKGDYSISDKNIYSDLILAAIIDCAVQFQLIKDEKINTFINSFSNSNFFPYVKLDKKELFFIPVPLLWKKFLINVGKQEDHKKIKKCEFIEVSLFNKLKKVIFNKDLVSESILSEVSYDKIFMYNKNETRGLGLNFYQAYENGRNVQSRFGFTLYMDNENENENEEKRIVPYFVERVKLGTNAGYYFFVHSENNEFLGVFEKALEILSKNGIGSDKNVGNGRFEVVKNFEIDSNQPELSELFNFSGDYVMNLGLYSPEKDNLEYLKDASYQLIKRGGWITNPLFLTLRKKNIILIKEGSCFSSKIIKNGKCGGVVHDLSPDWNQEIKPIIKRNGKSLFVHI